MVAVLLLCFLEVISMNAFVNDEINIFCCKCLNVIFLHTVFPLISAGSQISAAPLDIHIEISATR